MSSIFKAQTVVLIVPFLLLSVPNRLSAGETGSPQSAEGQIAELKKLREEQVDKFQHKIEVLRSDFRQKLEALRTENPELWNQLRQKRKFERAEHIKHFARENPERFREFAARRFEHLQRLRQDSPERFRHFLEEHPRIHDRLKRFREQRQRSPQSDQRRRPTFDGQKNAGRQSSGQRIRRRVTHDRKSERSAQLGHPRYGGHRPATRGRTERQG